jgi:hypothetical protein
MNTPQCLLACGCWTQVRVDLARLYRAVACPHGHGETSIMKVNTHEWRVRCPDCRYGRWCGQDKGDAMHRQSEHKRQHPLHFPSVAFDRVTFDGGGSILRWDGKRPRKGPATPAEPLPRAVDGPIPF